MPPSFVQPPEGGSLLLVDKPLFWSSFQVVQHFKRLVYPAKIGHAGTLDPLATGLLLLATGRQTKTISTLQELDKTYSGTLLLGTATESYDRETPRLFQQEVKLTPDDLQQVLQQFTGPISQVPPTHSAVKVDGRRSYHIARAGTEATLKTRKVTVYRFDLTRICLPEADFVVQCSKGTYIRSLVHNVGQVLGCGATLTALRREAIGPYTVANADTSMWELNSPKADRLKEKVRAAGWQV